MNDTLHSEPGTLRENFEAHLKVVKPWMNEEDFQDISKDIQCYETFTTAHKLLPRAIFNHCTRVFIYSLKTSVKSFPSWKCIFREYPEAPSSKIIYIASMYHDIGATPEYNGDQRFEIEGADTAVDLMDRNGASKHDMSAVWEAIALHTSPGISERISPMALCIRIGVKMDFTRQNRFFEKSEVDGLCTEIEKVLPRLEIEKVLGDAVVVQSVKNPAKAPKVSWPWCLLVAHQANPDHEGVNPGF